MHRLASVTGAALIGLGALVAPVWSQDKPPAAEAPVPHATPKQGSNAETGASGSIEGKAHPDKEGGPPAQGPGGCPLFNRKLELIV
jgi:hypothetical protein